MVAARTSQALELLMEKVNDSNGAIGPRDLQRILMDAKFSRTEIQQAIQLALSRNMIRFGSDLKVEAAVAA